MDTQIPGYNEDDDDSYDDMEAASRKFGCQTFQNCQ